MPDQYKYSFEKLEIWQLARILAKEIYKLTTNLPIKERFGLIDQLRRSAISVVSNIAEGSTRTSMKDQAYMIERAYGSLIEILCQLILCNDLGYITTSEYQHKRIEIERIS